MQTDEQAIRKLINTWMEATAQGNAATIEQLMAEDVVFLLPGQSPMRGRDAFMVNFQTALSKIHINATSQVQEIQVSGDLAYCWNYLVVTVTPLAGGAPVQRSGFTLTVLRKETAGNWVVFRDANLLTTSP